MPVVTDVSLVLAATILAVALRAWNLWDIPGPTDELQSVQRGLAIARGEMLPLTDHEPYIGSAWTFLLAAGFLLVGPSELVGRTLTLIVGAATIPTTYLFAREIGGRWVAAIAALLVTTSSAHTLATSHPAWSHAMTPLFLTLGLWQVARCIRIQRRSALLAAAVCLGLALQSHLTMLAVLPGVAAALLLGNWRWLTSRWLYIAAIIGLLCVTNILIFNLATGLSPLNAPEWFNQPTLARRVPVILSSLATPNAWVSPPCAP